MWRRKCGPTWFGDWTWVVGAAALNRVLPAKGALYSTRPVWGAPGTFSGRPARGIPGALGWRDFWMALQTCGPMGTTRWASFGGEAWRDLNEPEAPLQLPESLLAAEDSSTAVVWLGEGTLRQ